MLSPVWITQWNIANKNNYPRKNGLSIRTRTKVIRRKHIIQEIWCVKKSESVSSFVISRLHLGLPLCCPPCELLSEILQTKIIIREKILKLFLWTQPRKRVTMKTVDYSTGSWYYYPYSPYPITHWPYHITLSKKNNNLYSRGPTHYKDAI